MDSTFYLIHIVDPHYATSPAVGHTSGLRNPINLLLKIDGFFQILLLTGTAILFKEPNSQIKIKKIPLSAIKIISYERAKSLFLLHELPLLFYLRSRP